MKCENTNCNANVRRRVKSGGKMVCPACRSKDNPAAKFVSAVRGLSKSNVSSNAPHIIVEALAGTGKTFTLIEGLNRIKGQFDDTIVGSPQQEVVWQAMQEGSVPHSICFAAFNKSIATELQSKVPQGCNAMTLHSLGFKSIRETYGKAKFNNYKVWNIIEDILNKDIRELRKSNPVLVYSTEKLVALCKQNLITMPAGKCYIQDELEKELADLASYYDVECNGKEEEVFALVPKVLRRCSEVTREIDFNDMVWLPVVNSLATDRFDLLLVDEGQDLNRCQQQLVLKSGSRIVLVGDRNQAIYGFAGADANSIDRMRGFLEERGEVETFPLTVSRRCCKAIVSEAASIVPSFESLPDAPQGIVDRMDPEKLVEEAKDGDFIVCRVNAPLVSYCFRFLKEGRKANIQGKDIGKGLITLCKKLAKGNEDISYLVQSVDDWYHQECKKENRKRCPRDSVLIALEDKHSCLMVFCEECLTLQEVIGKIDAIFTDDNKEGVRLSSIHKAKGLESDRVFILNSDLLPHPMAKSAWQQEQESNLKYVAITRAKLHLTFC